MKANVAALTVIGLLAIGFYALLSGGAGNALSNAFVENSMPGLVEPTSTPGLEVRLPVWQTPTPAPTAIAPPPQPEHRGDCNQIRGTAYESGEERDWYLENCVNSENRADCNRIRGTRYLSPAERAWYLTNCVR